jgi:UvrD-like helicase C-terminal domain
MRPSLLDRRRVPAPAWLDLQRLHHNLTQHYAMLQRNLLYTGITRGKRLVVLVGQKKAIAIAVRNVSGRRRWSKLDEWLRLGAPSRSSNSSKAD